MHLHYKFWGRLLLLLFFGGLVVKSGQAPQRVVSPHDSLKERVLFFYRTIQKGNKVGALDVVAPDSKNAFLQLNYDSLVDFRILNVQFSDDGNAAAVKILRTDRFAGFPQLLDHETIDMWKRIDGQWYVLFPSSKEVDTPFGKMRFGEQGKESQAVTPQGLMPERQNNIDLQRYGGALQKVVQEEDKKKAQAKKAEEKKKSDGKEPEGQTAPKQEPQG